jgi:hypothetical protein
MQRHVWPLLAAALILIACGGGIGSYDEGMEAQLNAMEDMVKVLKGVTDQSSAEAATSKIESIGERMADVAAQMQKLPQPDMEEMQALMEKHGRRMQQFQGEAMGQLMKLAKYPELMDAYTRAVSNAR